MKTDTGFASLLPATLFVSCILFASTASATVVLQIGSLTISTSTAIAVGGAAMTSSESNTSTTTSSQFLSVDGSSNPISLIRAAGTSFASASQTGTADFVDPSAVAFSFSGSSVAQASNFISSATAAAHVHATYSFAVDSVYNYALATENLIAGSYRISFVGPQGQTIRSLFIGGTHTFTGTLQPGRVHS